MIYINMGGGRLGNQFFRYAFARLLQKHNPGEVIIYNCDEIHRTYCTSGFHNENTLRYFNTRGVDYQDAINYSIAQYIILKIYNRFFPHGGSFKSINRYDRKWVKVLEFFGLYFLNLGYYPFRLKKPWWVKDIIVNGSFECDRYFSEIKDELLEAFQAKEPLQEYNQELMQTIQSTKSIAISIRRGDFVDDPQIKSKYFVCDKTYYEQAISLIREKIVNPTFIFFSNDIEWVKQNIHIEGCQCYYESGRDEQWEVMRLMSACKHFIISNSTFHWWAQYLSTNKNKIVIAPSRWFNDEYRSEIYQDNWITLPVGADRK